MVARFCLYSILKNLRFADPFLAIYLIELGFSYAEIGAILGFEKLVTALLELPSGIGADRWGRRSVLALSFACHAVGLTILAIGADVSQPGAIWFYAGLGVYGVGEAFRTGNHKAIMLDYLKLAGRPIESTSVLSLTRTFSKVSSALAGLLAGGLLYLLHDYGILFWLSASGRRRRCKQWSFRATPPKPGHRTASDLPRYNRVCGAVGVGGSAAAPVVALRDGCSRCGHFAAKPS